MLARVLRPAIVGFAIALSAAVPARLAHAQDRAEVVAEEAAAEAAHGDVHDEHAPFYEQTTFWAAVINFTLLLLVLRKLGSKPVAAFLQDRRRVMERSISEAAEMRAKAEALHKEYTQRLAQLDQDLQKLRDDIARAAEDDKKQIVADAEETARRLRSETEGLIEQHAKALSASVRREVVEAATSAAEQILRGSLTDSDQQRLADGFKQDLAGSGSKDARTTAERKPEARTRAEGTP
jgi:F-type H+-transporting ATPase subunit b